MRDSVVLLLALAVCGSLALRRSDQYMHDDQYDGQYDDDQFDDDQLDEQFDDDQFDDHLKLGFIRATQQRYPTVARQLLGFSWKSCAGSSALVDVDSISISPDTLYFPGYEYVSAKVTVKEPLTSPLKAKVKLMKKIGWFWVHAPCINNVGSCTYDDICAMLRKMKDLRCPIKQKTYILNIRVALPAANVPSGNYWLKVDVTHNWQRVACIEVYFSVG